MSKQTIIVIAHDAGGANVIAAYLKKNADAYDVHAYAGGPAREIFGRAGILFQSAPEAPAALEGIMRLRTDAAFALIAAPGWMTETEANAIDAAKKAGLKTIAYMDSWGGEKDRYAGHVPDEFWAGDEYQERLAHEAYPDVPVTVVGNEHIEDIKRRFAEKTRGAKPQEILFMSDAVPGVEQILDQFLEALPRGTTVRIRFHPADKRTRYDAVLKKHAQVNVLKSLEKDMVDDLARAAAVVGTETAAMVAALLVGKKTICLAHKKREAFLPHPGIIRVRHPEDAVALLA